MKLSNIFMIMMIAAVAFLSSCKDDAPVPVATINYKPVTATNSVDGDVTGTGGSATKTYTWQNSRATAEYNMDITSVKGGKMQVVIKDANGNTVLDHALEAGVTPDSKSGVSATGTAGDWTITVTLTNFSGDGSFSISQGPDASIAFQPAATPGDINGNVTGNGDSATNSSTWQNASATADYSMSLAGATSGKMQIVIKDAIGNTVLDQTLEAGVAPDSKSGVTAAGVAGEWTITVILTNFNGNGSFSFSQGT